jgi:hypothetical protein
MSFATLPRPLRKPKTGALQRKGGYIIAWHFIVDSTTSMDNRQSLFDPSGENLPSPIRQQTFTLIVSCVTAVCMSFTIFFAYNSSMETPVSTKLIFSNPERSILALNVLSQVTIFFLHELMTSVLKATRWAFASSASGVSAFAFLSMSRATSIVGVLCLLKGKGPTPHKVGKDGHRLLGGQR